MDRREFVTGAGVCVLRPLLSTVGFSTVSCSRPATVAGKPISPLGVQLYTLRNLMERGVEETLMAVSHIGFEEVEFAGYFGHSAAEIKRMLDDAGLEAPATHVGLDVVRNNLESTIEFGATVGHEYLIVPSLPASEQTADGYRRIADEFNRIAEVCDRAGMKFGYHNHDAVFASMGDRSGYDILIGQTEAGLVWMELDLFWIASAGADALKYFADYPGRFRLCHLKDMDQEGRMTDVGAGTLDFETLLTAGVKAGLEHFFVEHDRPADPIESVRSSLSFLEGLRI